MCNLYDNGRRNGLCEFIHYQTNVKDIPKETRIGEGPIELHCNILSKVPNKFLPD